MRSASLLLLGLAGCAPTLHVYTDNPEEHRVTIRDAGRMMDVRLKVVDQPGPGAVEVDFKDDDEGLCGVALERAIGYPTHPSDALTRAPIDCTPRAWSCPSPIYLSHELGHVSGLDHKDGTAMAPSPEPGAKFTRRQKLLMQSVVVVFTEACGVPAGNVTDPREPPPAQPSEDGS